MTPPSAKTATRQREMDILEQEKHEKCAQPQSAAHSPGQFSHFLIFHSPFGSKIGHVFQYETSMLCVNELVTVSLLTFSGLCAKIEDRNRIVKCASIPSILITSLTPTHFHRHNIRRRFIFVIGHRRWRRQWL